MNQGLDTLDILALAIIDDGIIYAGTNGYEIYMFDPGLKQWESMGRTIGFGYGKNWF